VCYSISLQLRGEIGLIIWINGAFGSGKTTISQELHRRIPNSFLFDPEYAGYYIRSNSPKSMVKGDFQDIALWREFNYSMLKWIATTYKGIVVVPMTLVNPEYFNEIVGQLRRDGIEVRHVALMASKETLLKRLKRRGDNGSSWPARQIDRCIAGLSQNVFQTHIRTDELTIEDILKQIAALFQIDLQPDNRSRLRKKLERITYTIKNIRPWRRF
jgi:hypothetical protein